MTSIRRILLACGVAGFSGGTYCQEASQQPFELVRSLRTLQDLQAYGNATAHVTQKAIMAQTAERLDQFEDAVWKEPKNVRAVVEFVLSGGSPRTLRSILARGATGGVDAKLVKGTLAYADGRSAEAADMLSGLDARLLDPSVAGQIALVQAELIARKDTGRAAALLDQARLLSPGTLIEEAALRRLAAIFAAASNFRKFETVSAVYLRRYPRSIYAGGFRQQFATQVAVYETARDPDRLAKLKGMLASLDAKDRRDVFLAMAHEAILRGRIVLSRFAAGEAALLADNDTLEATRAKLYEAAALVATDQLETGLAALKGLKRTDFSRQDAELLDAALSLAHQVAGSPPPAAGTTMRPRQDASGPEPKILEPARQAIARVDQLLNGAKK